MPPEALVRGVTAVARSPLARAAVVGLERTAPWRRGVVTILTYHRVDDPEARPDLAPSLLSATPAAFAEQVDDLARHYRPISLEELLAAARDPRSLPPRAVHVTVDDAYPDFAANAWPVLRAAGVPATLFVPTGFPDRPGAAFWWDRVWHAIATTARPEVVAGPAGAQPLGDAGERRRAMLAVRDWLKSLEHEAAMAEADQLVVDLGPATPAPDDPAAPDAPASTAPTTANAPAPDRPTTLGWDALRALAAEGVTLAPHTRHHPLLDRVPLERAIAEIEGSVEDLEREVGPTPRVLAYPSGAHGGHAVEAARRAGMVLAVTTERGGNDLRHADRLRLRRINVGARARSALVRGQLVWAATVDARRR